VLSAVTKADLEGKFAALESKSTIQLVVATVPSLNGQEIEPYANALFRYWKLGTAAKNNGVLFLIAPHEHRVRIEVGYGLEGTLTDAISSVIIANAATPKFKAGDFDGGVTRASDDIVTTLTTDADEWRSKPDFRAHPARAPDSDNSILPLLIFIAIFLLILYLNHRSRRSGGAWFVPINLGGGGWSSGGGGGGGGGFSGGGGSSGGGGASGSW
jgi:uncharacterized protein